MIENKRLRTCEALWPTLEWRHCRCNPGDVNGYSHGLLYAWYKPSKRLWRLSSRLGLAQQLRTLEKAQEAYDRIHGETDDSE